MSYSRIQDESEAEVEETEFDHPSRWLPLHLYSIFSHKNLLSTVLALWIVTLVVLAWVLSRRIETLPNHATTPLPFTLVPSRVIMFNPDERYHYTAEDAGETAWLALMPNDGGTVSIDHPRRFQLPSSVTDLNNSTSEVYSTSVFHQLHCLNSIRVRLGILGGYINATETGRHHEKRKVRATESHVDHCFDYLRQAIMCAGDMSLERSVAPDDFGFNGWGTAHQCADWDSMWNFAVRQRYNLSTNA